MKNKIVRPRKVVRPKRTRSERKKPPRKARSERVANKRSRRGAGRGAFPESIQKAVAEVVLGFFL